MVSGSNKPSIGCLVDQVFNPAVEHSVQQQNISAQPENMENSVMTQVKGRKHEADRWSPDYMLRLRLCIAWGWHGFWICNNDMPPSLWIHTSDQFKIHHSSPTELNAGECRHGLGRNASCSHVKIIRHWRVQHSCSPWNALIHQYKASLPPSLCSTDPLIQSLPPQENPAQGLRGWCRGRFVRQTFGA